MLQSSIEPFFPLLHNCKLQLAPGSSGENIKRTRVISLKSDLLSLIIIIMLCTPELRLSNRLKANYNITNIILDLELSFP